MMMPQPWSIYISIDTRFWTLPCCFTLGQTPLQTFRRRCHRQHMQSRFRPACALSYMADFSTAMEMSKQTKFGC